MLEGNTILMFTLLALSLILFVEFRAGKSPILIATDVASRGLGMFMNAHNMSCLLLVFFWVVFVFVVLSVFLFIMYFAVYCGIYE